MELKQTLKISQQLLMTPQLQQAIKLLQITRAELLELVNDALKTNPLLEDENIDGKTTETTRDEGTAVDFKTMKERIKIDDSIKKMISIKDDFSEDAVFHEKQEDERVVRRDETLHDRLLWQLHVEAFSEKEKEIGVFIIGNIDEDGYLRTSIEEIAAHFNCPPKKVEEVLLNIQNFEPPGVGARNLRECLLIQLRQKNINDPLIEKILETCIKELEERDISNIARKLGVTERMVRHAIKFLNSLEPKPGRSISLNESVPISPDIIVKKVGNEYVVSLNDDGLPRLKLNKYYTHLLLSNDTSPDVLDYLNEKMRSAKWLVNGIHKRNQSILLVAKSIVKHQREFLDKGIDFLKPLALREVSDDVNLSESTVSRVCRGKYMDTPQGIFEMKYFFSTRIATTEGNLASVELLKRKIKGLISEESANEPLTDESIADELRKMNFEISRRTVVKYRKKLGIPPSRKRKNII